MCPDHLKHTPTDHKAVKSEYKNVFMDVQIFFIYTTFG